MALRGRIFTAGRPPAVRVLAAALTAAALAALAAQDAPAAPATGHRPRPNPLRSLLGSSELWSTIDVCSPGDQPEWVGVRGSMPGDGHPHDRLYMSFRLQYLNTSAGRWIDIAKTLSRYVYVGTGAAARQGGTSFEVTRGAVPSTLRGVVRFEWRRGGIVMQATSRATSAGHRSVRGGDPPGYSAASCIIG
jgi:hypothetical protein